MAKFTSPVLNYSLGQIIVARVTAHNEKGYSDSTSLSSDGIAVAKTVPVQMSSASITRGSLTSETQIQVNWSPLTSSTDTGGSAILSYNLQFDSGTGLWVDLVGYSSDYSQLTYTVTDGLTKGIAYQFRIRARNIYGWALLLSDPSTIIKTSGVPAQMFKVTTSYDTGVDPTSVKITWLQPYSNSEPVIDYQVVIRHKDFSTFSEESVNCNGAVDPAKTSLYCFVPLTVLRSNPYFLEFNDLVVAKARARNAWGYGIYSESNTAGASIQTEPSAPASPTLDIVLSTLTQIKVDWSPLTGLNTGESPITSYNLQWDAASNGVTWSDLSGQDGALSTELTFTKAGLTPGSYYGFKLRARNVHGWSTSFSAIVQYQSAQWPDKPLPVTTILVNTSIRISWQQPADNFKTITKYRVQIQTQSGSFVENTLFCDGSDLTVMSLRRCDVPVLDILRSTPYSLI